ncbi:MAG: hypothetical protein JWN11_2375, partial [Hyphomicrobiales bacterium]|nr:hypothetical protein [Hyphomicrobiales bacterium]
EGLDAIIAFIEKAGGLTGQRAELAKTV